MRPRCNYIWFFLITLFYLTGFPEPGCGYVLQGSHLLDLMTVKTGKAERIQVMQSLLIYDDNPLGDPIVIKETVRYLFPDSFRSDTETAAAKRIHVVSGNTAVTVIDGRITDELDSDLDRYKDIMLYRSRISLGERLRSLGIDITITSLGRFQEKIAYVLGAQYPDASAPQLWIDRETFRPIRWLIRHSTLPDVSKRLELRYYNWQRIQGVWYPLRVEFYEGEQLVREIRVEQVKINPPFAEGLFDLSYIRAMYQPAPAAAPESTDSEGIGDIQKTIDEFRKIFE